MWRFRAIAALLLSVVGICLACNDRNVPPKNPTEEGTATIILSAVTNSSQTELFHELKQASRLPSAVLDKLGGIADPGQPYNTTDVIDPKLPMRGLVVAAVSEKYCIVTYWQGGMTLGLETRIFELSAGRVKRIWVSAGGGLNFRDLKNTVESGRLLRFQQVPVTPDFGAGGQTGSFPYSESPQSLGAIDRHHMNIRNRSVCPDFPLCRGSVCWM